MAPSDSLLSLPLSLQICGILLSRSTPHLHAISEAYGHHANSLSKMVSSEFSGHMRDSLLYVTDTVQAGPINIPGVSRDADLLEDSMRGAGTKDERLVYRLVRAHWDRRRFEAVKADYAARHHKKGLLDRVSGETSGDYKRMLCAIVGR